MSSYSVLPNLLAEFEGAASRRRREKEIVKDMGTERKERGRKSRRRNERGGTGVKGRYLTLYSFVSFRALCA